MNITDEQENKLAQEQPINWPAPYLPSNVIEEVTRIGGRDYFGDPVLRLVWGQKETRYVDGDLRMKYPWFTREHTYWGYYDIGIPRWVLEQKFYPTILDLATWKPWQGAKPYRGIYKAIMVVEGPQGEFLSLAFGDAEPFLEFLRRTRWAKDHSDYKSELDEPMQGTESQQAVQAMEDAHRAREAKERAERRFMIRKFYDERRRRHTTSRPNAGRGY